MHFAAPAHRPCKSFLQTLIRIICAFIVIVDPHSLKHMHRCSQKAFFFPSKRGAFCQCLWGGNFHGRKKRQNIFHSTKSSKTPIQSHKVWENVQLFFIFLASESLKLLIFFYPAKKARKWCTLWNLRELKWIKFPLESFATVDNKDSLCIPSPTQFATKFHSQRHSTLIF